MNNKVAEALEEVLDRGRTPWAWIVIGASVLYIAAHFAWWVWHGLPVE